jgi:hypothetical protein
MRAQYSDVWSDHPLKYELYLISSVWSAPLALYSLHSLVKGSGLFQLIKVRCYSSTGCTGTLLDCNGPMPIWY